MIRPSGLGLLLAAALVPAAAAVTGASFTVSMREIADYKSVFATVESVEETTARARIAGTITKLSIDEGSAVETGQVVAVVEDEKLPLRLAALDARIRALESQRQLAEVEVQRTQTLRERGAVSQARLDDARTNLEVLEGQLAAVQAEREVVVEEQRQGAVLAPAAGRVLEVSVTEGSVVLPGEVIATIATERYVLRMHLPERHARFMQVGDPVLVAARGLGECGRERREGRIRQVYPRLDRGRVVADVEVEGLGDFFVGERTCVYVPTGTRRTVVIPPDYLFRRFGVAYVRVEGIGEVVVQPGQSLPEGIEILSGLQDGDVLLPP